MLSQPMNAEVNDPMAYYTLGTHLVRMFGEIL